MMKPNLFVYLILVLIVSNLSCKKDNVTGSSDILTDSDGNEYATVMIGEQVWMAENLRTTKYNDGSSIPNVISDEEWNSLTSAGVASYNNTTDTDTLKTFGRLYNWRAVNTGKLCPAGWHIPEIYEFIQLRDYLAANGYNSSGENTGNSCAKSLASETGWLEEPVRVGAPGNPERPELQNATGFNGYPAGQRGSNSSGAGYFAIWWSQTEADEPDVETHAWRFYLSYALPPTYINISEKHFGYSVRCVQD